MITSHCYGACPFPSHDRLINTRSSNPSSIRSIHGRPGRITEVFIACCATSDREKHKAAFPRFRESNLIWMNYSYLLEIYASMVCNE
jgi:hypothetical protein